MDPLELPKSDLLAGAELDSEVISVGGAGGAVTVTLSSAMGSPLGPTAAAD